MRRSLMVHLRARFRLLLALGVMGGLCRAGAEVPAERSFEALLAAVERSTGISSSAAAWEPSRGALADLTLGRALLVNGRVDTNQPRDVHRVFVRVAPDGVPLEVGRSYNLTSTALADEQSLLVRGPLAIFATVAFDRVQSVTVLDSRGVYRDDAAGSWRKRWGHHVELAVTSFLETGTTRGLGRTDLEFVHSPAELEIELSPGALKITAGDDDWQLEEGSFGLRLRPNGKRDEPPDLAVLPRLSLPKPPLHWLADAGRTVLGVGPIAWLEGRAFSLLDHLRRLNYGLRGAREETDDLGEGSASAGPDPKRDLPEAPPHDGAEIWPPEPLPSPWKTPRPGEGEWQAVEVPFLRRMPGAESAPPYFFRTFVRPDKERPYAEVLLVAMDMRRLELGMEAGYEDPRPTAGRPGAGHVPADPESYRRIVATFNGAFKTTHGEYGMVVNRRVLVPPVPGAATVRVDSSGAVGLGTWPASSANQQDASGGDLPPEIVSLRQNLDPLIEGDRVNPTGRQVWGDQLYGQGVAAERSALCVTQAGHLVYAWGEEASGETLGEALRMASCEYGIHLDMNPGHCSFAFTNIVDFERVEADAEVLDPRMRVNPKRYIRWSPKDFFYVSLRDPLPRSRGANFRVAPGAQPEPSWLPGIFQSDARVGPLEIDILRFEVDRVRWQAAPGSAEPRATAAPSAHAGAPENVRPLVTVGLGHSTRAARYGLAIGGARVVPLDPSLATLLLPQDGVARLEPPGTPLQIQSEHTLVQLPLLSQDGELTARARQPGALRERGALCLDGEGNLLVARVTHDSSAPAAQALVQLGCGLVVETDRGSQHPIFVERADETLIRRGPRETTVLYGVGRAARPRASWLRPDGS